MNNKRQNSTNKVHLFPKITNWDNKDNIQYYENIPIKILQELAIRGGFESGCDIDLIYGYIASKNSILELGAGYGRVIRNILERGYKGTLHAVERSTNFYKYLLNNFRNRANIIHSDFATFKPHQSFDVILGMWSWISEFPKEQQLNVIKKILSLLNPNGMLILDTISPELIPTNVSITEDQAYVVFSKYRTAYGYTATTEEFDQQAKQLSLKNIKHINYKTSTGRDRILHILEV